jgi:hypothetical protein
VRSTDQLLTFLNETMSMTDVYQPAITPLPPSLLSNSRNIPVPLVSRLSPVDPLPTPPKMC